GELRRAGHHGAHGDDAGRALHRLEDAGPLLDAARALWRLLDGAQHGALEHRRDALVRRTHHDMRLAAEGLLDEALLERGDEAREEDEHGHADARAAEDEGALHAPLAQEA